MDPNLSAFYQQLYQSHWWCRSRERWILQILNRCSPPDGWGSILDVGCGDGLFFDRLAAFGEVEGVESCRAIVDPAGPHFAKIHIGPFDESFRPNKQYSLILLLDVLEHIPSACDALRQCTSLLKPGGTLLITVPAFNLVWTNHDVLNHHVTRYRRATLFPLLKQAGLNIENSEYWFHWIFPLRLAERLIQTLFDLRPSTPSIPPPPVNRALAWISSMEYSVLGPLRLPFGTTLFVRCTR